MLSLGLTLRSPGTSLGAGVGLEGSCLGPGLGFELGGWVGGLVGTEGIAMAVDRRIELTDYP